MSRLANSRPVVVWFRHDLRLADNPALREACRSGQPVIPLFLWAPEEAGREAPGGASCWWLHYSLLSLRTSLRRRRSELVIRRAPDSMSGLGKVLSETGARMVFWNHVHDPAAWRRDRQILKRLSSEGVLVQSFEATLLFPVRDIRNRQDQPFQVFTPFWRHCLENLVPEKCLPGPSRIPRPTRFPPSLEVEDLGLLSRVDWAAGLRAAWEPGEPGAHRALRRFLARNLASYAKQRDRPDLEGTSRLSPHLHFGEISARWIWQAVEKAEGIAPAAADSVRIFRQELGWREFAHHLLAHFPRTSDRPLRPEFSRFPWRRDPAALKAWQRGRTGYPIVDAGMRQLWRTGWMHNRVRMIVASFLVKDLLLPWQEGARWFWDTLLDADLANNTLGWQWTAGCGADAAPYFRVFNPVLQATRFDPEGAYVRRWVPELAKLSLPWIHQPWAAPSEALRQAGVTIGKTYPSPLVEHEHARDRALLAFSRLKDAAP